MGREEFLSAVHSITEVTRERMYVVCDSTAYCTRNEVILPGVRSNVTLT